MTIVFEIVIAMAYSQYPFNTLSLSQTHGSLIPTPRRINPGVN